MGSVQTFGLSNGMRVVCQRMAVPSISVGLWIGAGSMHETAEENGCAHFLEHMLFKSTEHRTAKQIALEMDAVGGHMNAFTEKEDTCYYARIIPKHLPQTLALLSDLLICPRLDQQEFETEKGVILDEIAMTEDDPEELAEDLAAQAFFGSHPLARPILGHSAHISAIGRDALLAYRKRHYRPDNTVLSIAGAIPEADRLLEMTEELFGSWTKGVPCETDLQSVLKAPGLLVRERAFEQTQIVFCSPAPARDDPELPDAWALSMLLGEGNASRLFQRVRERMGAAYNVYSDIASYPGIGVFTIAAGTSPKEAPKVLRALREELQLLIRNGVTEEEVRTAREQLRISCILGDESSEDRMTVIGRSLLLRGRVKDTDETLKEIDGITRDGVMQMAERIFSKPFAAAAAGKGVRKLQIDLNPVKC